MQKPFEILKFHRQDVLKETMKKLTFAFHLVPIYGLGVELVSSLSLTCKICLDKFIFWSDPFNLKSVERKGKTIEVLNISRMKRAF